MFRGKVVPRVLEEQKRQMASQVSATQEAAALPRLRLRGPPECGLPGGSGDHGNAPPPETQPKAERRTDVPGPLHCPHPAISHHKLPLNELIRSQEPQGKGVWELWFLGAAPYPAGQRKTGNLSESQRVLAWRISP